MAVCLSFVWIFAVTPWQIHSSDGDGFSKSCVLQAFPAQQQWLKLHPILVGVP